MNSIIVSTAQQDGDLENITDKKTNDNSSSQPARNSIVNVEGFCNLVNASGIIKNMNVVHAVGITDQIVLNTLFFTNVVFEEEFSFAQNSGNSFLIFENCVFKKEAKFENIHNKKVIIRHCKFKGLLKLSRIHTDYIEFVSNNHIDDVAISNCKTDLYFVANLKFSPGKILTISNFLIETLTMGDSQQ